MAVFLVVMVPSEPNVPTLWGHTSALAEMGMKEMDESVQVLIT